MEMNGWELPVDPDCPKVKDFVDSLYGDGYIAEAPNGEIQARWEQKHVADCERCQEYGAANIEVA